MVEYGEIGPSPSGKALGFGPSIRRFESCRSSQEEKIASLLGIFLFLRPVLDEYPAGPARLIAPLVGDILLAGGNILTINLCYNGVWRIFLLLMIR